MVSQRTVEKGVKKDEGKNKGKERGKKIRKKNFFQSVRTDKDRNVTIGKKDAHTQGRAK